jgi:hypothetical protein
MLSSYSVILLWTLLHKLADQILVNMRISAAFRLKCRKFENNYCVREDHLNFESVSWTGL